MHEQSSKQIVARLYAFAVRRNPAVKAWFTSDKQAKLLRAVERAQRPAEGAFRVLPSGVVQMQTAKPWKLRAPLLGVVKRRRRGIFEFKARVGFAVAEALRADEMPVLADRLIDATRKFAPPGRGLPIDPITEMREALEPGEVKHPIGREVLAEIAEMLRIGAPAKLALYSYQIVGVAFCKMLGYRAIIGDSPGLGKTAQALAPLIVDGPKMLPAVVVAPSVVFTNWQDEAAKWLPNMALWPMPKRGSPPPPEGFRGLVVTTFALVSHQVSSILTCSPRSLIIDEAHRIKNSETQQAQAVTHLAAQIPHVMLLTGTPIENGAHELWGLIQVVNPAVGGSTVDDLRTALPRMMIRRLKEQVAKDLPEITRQYVHVEAPADAMEDYRKAEQNFEEWLREELTRRIEAGLVAAGADPSEQQSEIYRQVQIRAERAIAAEALSQVGYLRQLVGRMKVDAAVEIIQNLVAAGEPVIAFGVHQDVIQGLTTRMKAVGIRVGVIDGSTPKKQRGKLIEMFQAGELDVILGSEAMREGVTLTRSRTVVMVEHMWTPAREEQAESRAHRSGQKNAVSVIYLEVADTLDVRINAIIESKRSTVKDVVGAADVEAQQNTMQALVGSYIGGERSPLLPPAQQTKQQRKRSKNAIRRRDVVAVVFDPNLWTISQARSWMLANKFGKLPIETIQGRLVARTGQGPETPKGKSVKIVEGVSIVV